ncbi:DUF4396 domain-containing protein [Streptomyces sp. NPDC050211]|uniref:DUF4396 domain-containing protein n=1 Tax=Streptomyces sp. NPDC050211 TaxID=3154932 RepID=UPI003444058F
MVVVVTGNELTGADGTSAPVTVTVDAGLDDALFWWVPAIAPAVAFVLTTPVNKWMIGRGKGHAVVHQYHH